MFFRIECPGCKAVLQVEEALAGKQGKCIHCGHKIVVPNKSGVAESAPSQVLFLTEATPEAMIAELHEREKSAVLLLFEPGEGESYDLTALTDDKVKCIATEDINQQRFVQVLTSFAKRFARRPTPVQPAAAPGNSAAFSGNIGPDVPYELKGDRLGMTIAEFKQKNARFTPDGRQDLPICSDMPGYIGRPELHSEAWHRQAKLVHARIDLPHEDNSPTIASVKTDLLLYQFVDGLLFRISAFFATDLFHLVSDAVLKKYGTPTRETRQPRELEWENNVSRIVLTRGTVHPRTPSTLHLVHKQLLHTLEARVPGSEADL
jgi:hypothetical protein